ncbi:MAG: branched-chain amino acid transport system substrate-binding protein [Pseudonocardiales bacterium]|jgi:class 3 adenylate cyclase/ABC-type branched-subunit amino acid transport system substrate-binding protein|nr:branched-chain amino acid transport system substrate-binding protein [Pseudonocardiales bacterium]
MVDDGASVGTEARVRGGATRGFMFADLRGYTAYVEKEGPTRAADLLDRYRAIVRTAVAEHEGAEIKTEGDSFYVVFGSVSEALRCALAIVERSGAQGAGPDGPIAVGIGIHAGETLETNEGYVGQPVNVAARLCALAAAGEVLVSGTVRTLAMQMIDAAFEPRGRRRLKGISEPIDVYAVRAGRLAARPSRRPSRRVLLTAIAGAAVIAVASVWLLRATAPLTGHWTIGLTLPSLEAWQPLQRAADLAIADARANHPASTYDLSIAVSSEGGASGDPDPQLGAANAASFVADPSVIAMIGAGTSNAAERQIPITNAAGLLHCSPTNTDPGLTKLRDGAGDLRSSFPTRINYVRLPAASDVEAGADASFAYNDLHASNALVVDDTRPLGTAVADSFQREFEALGGTYTRRALNPGLDAIELLNSVTSAGLSPTLVFFGGLTDGGAPQLRQAMIQAGHADWPFVSWDGLWDGSGATADSFISLAGAAANGSYVSHPTVGTIRAEFEQHYRAAYGDVPAGPLNDYTAAAYACVQIVIASLDAAHGVGSDPTAVRDAVRAHAVDPTSSFDTVVGPVSFDANGDSVHQVVSYYRVDTAAAGGLGDWVIVKQQDFGPAR